jgi:hypothetical protein
VSSLELAGGLCLLALSNGLDWIIWKQKALRNVPFSPNRQIEQDRRHNMHFLRTSPIEIPNNSITPPETSIQTIDLRQTIFRTPPVPAAKKNPIKRVELRS